MVANEETVVVELFNPTEIVQDLTEYIANMLEESEAEYFKNSCSALASEGNLFDLVTGFYDNLNKHLNEDSPMVMSILFSLMRHLDAETLVMLIGRICTDLSSSLEKPDIRLDILQELYSILPFNSNTRFTVFMTSLKYAVETQQEKKLLKDLVTSDIKALARSWGLSLEEERKFYLSLCDILERIEISRIDEQEILTQLLETFESSPVEELAVANKYAQRAIIGAIKSPLAVTKDPTVSTGHSRIAADIYHLAAVQNLKNSSSPTERGAYELLAVFCEGNYTQFKNFCDTNPGRLEEFGLSEEVCFDNIRLLSLASLADEEDPITYDQVAQALSIEQEEVEKWVVKGITSTLIDAKLDQLHQKIVINRASQRLFTDEQWIQLSSKLKNWRNSVQSVLQTVRKAREDHDKLYTQIR